MLRECTVTTSTHEGISTTSSISNMMTRPLNSNNSEIAMCSEVPENTLTPSLVVLTTDAANSALSAYSEFDVLNLNIGKRKKRTYQFTATCGNRPWYGNLSY